LRKGMSAASQGSSRDSVSKTFRATGTSRGKTKHVLLLLLLIGSPTEVLRSQIAVKNDTILYHGNPICFLVGFEHGELLKSPPEEETTKPSHVHVTIQRSSSRCIEFPFVHRDDAHRNPSRGR